MSAFTVTKEHIDAIVTTIIDYQSNYNVRSILDEYGYDSSRIGQTLWDENFRSVNYRYNENSKYPKYIFSFFQVSLIQAIKAIDCLNYQSCESPDYDSSKSKNIQDIIKNELLNELKYQHPDYDYAEWSL